MPLRARGRVAATADVAAGPANGGITQASPTGSPGVSSWLDPSQANFWVGAIFVGSVAYLLGAYVMLGRYRVPL